MVELVFNQPAYLWFLISIPLLIFSHFFFLRHSKNKAIKFANFEAIRRVTGKKLLTKNIILLIVRCLILTSLIFAIAGTVVWYEGMSNKNNFVVALDTSASMTAQDIEPSRLEAARDLALDFIDKLSSHSKIGIIGFAGVPFVKQPMTENQFNVKKAIIGIEPELAGGTDLAGTIITATNMMMTSQKGKKLILITDGSNTVGMFTSNSMQEAVKYAKKGRVIVDTIGVGSNVGPIGYLPAYYNVSAIFDDSSLRNISNETGGTYYHAQDMESLAQAYNLISDDSERAFLHTDISLPLLTLALLLLLFEWGILSTKFRRIP